MFQQGKECLSNKLSHRPHTLVPRVSTACFHLQKAKYIQSETTSGSEVICAACICIESKRPINHIVTLDTTSCSLLVREDNSENIHFLNLCVGHRDIYCTISFKLYKYFTNKSTPFVSWMIIQCVERVRKNESPWTS